MTEGKKTRLGPERQHRFFKARIKKFHRKLDRLGEKAVEPETFRQLMTEGNALLTFAAIDAMSKRQAE